ncbi:hypothetical protein LTR41_011955 [Exophiala xenobiotica]|nr:hypothetical protein LTR41_011955 [Exophiala xenobiotica]
MQTPAFKKVNPSARGRLPCGQTLSGSVTRRGISSKRKMTKARRQIRKGKSSTSSGLRSNFSDDGGYDTGKIPDEDWGPIMKKILKSSQDIRDTYGMSSPGEAKDYDDNRSSTVSEGPDGYAEYGREDGV